MLCKDLDGLDGGVGGKEFKEGWDIYIYICVCVCVCVCVWLIHFIVHQKPIKHCKATIPAIKKKKREREREQM